MGPKLTTLLGFKRSREDAEVSLRALQKNNPGLEFEIQGDNALHMVGRPGDVDPGALDRLRTIVRDYPVGGAIPGHDEALTSHSAVQPNPDQNQPSPGQNQPQSQPAGPIPVTP